MRAGRQSKPNALLSKTQQTSFKYMRRKQTYVKKENKSVVTRPNQVENTNKRHRPRPPGIPVLKTQNSPPPKKKFPKIPVR